MSPWALKCVIAALKRGVRERSLASPEQPPGDAGRRETAYAEAAHGVVEGTAPLQPERARREGGERASAFASARTR
jgi:hypothetical protein